MFITFHKQVSAIKIAHPEHSSFPPVPSLSLNPCFFPQVSISFSLNPVICLFKQLIRVLLCFYSRDYQYCRRRCCRALILPSFYQNRHFFFCKDKTTQYVRHTMHLFARFFPVITRERKRRSYANFRGRCMTRKPIFLAYVLDLGLANDICICRIEAICNPKCFSEQKQMYTI